MNYKFKADFSEEYTAPTPKSLLRRLVSLDYQLVEEAVSHLESEVLQQRGSIGADSLTILEVGCSFGLISSGFLYGESLLTWCRRIQGLDFDSEIVASDKARFSTSSRRNLAVDFVGLDPSSSAIRYAVDVGLLKKGYCENLEDNEPSSELKATRAYIIIATGCIGYVTWRTFERILGFTRPALIIFSCLRSVNNCEIIEGLRLSGYFVEMIGEPGVRQRLYDPTTEGQHFLRFGGSSDRIELAYHLADFYAARRSLHDTAGT